MLQLHQNLSNLKDYCFILFVKILKALYALTVELLNTDKSTSVTKAMLFRCLPEINVLNNLICFES